MTWGHPFGLAWLTSLCCGLRLQIAAGLADGSIDLVVGTHALISDSVAFSNLGLAVVDEQHRCARFPFTRMLGFCACVCIARPFLGVPYIGITMVVISRPTHEPARQLVALPRALEHWGPGSLRLPRRDSLRPSIIGRQAVCVPAHGQAEQLGLRRHGPELPGGILLPIIT